MHLLQDMVKITLNPQAFSQWWDLGLPSFESRVITDLQEPQNQTNRSPSRTDTAHQTAFWWVASSPHPSTVSMPNLKLQKCTSHQAEPGLNGHCTGLCSMGCLGLTLTEVCIFNSSNISRERRPQLILGLLCCWRGERGEPRWCWWHGQDRESVLLFTTSKPTRMHTMRAFI